MKGAADMSANSVNCAAKPVDDTAMKNTPGRKESVEQGAPYGWVLLQGLLAGMRSSMAEAAGGMAQTPEQSARRPVASVGTQLILALFGSMVTATGVPP